MEIWRTSSDEFKRPKVLTGGFVILAIVIHLAAFLGFWLFALLHGFFEPKEKVIPIDLSIVVNENLEGVDNRPPPLKNPDPPVQPKPQPRPQPRPRPQPQPPKEKPKPLEQIVTNVVNTVKNPQNKPNDKPKDKPNDKPKETAAERMRRRIEEMRRQAVKNKPVQREVRNANASDNGRTERRPKDWEKYFNAGYKPGNTNKLSESDVQLGISLVRMALDEKWDALNPKVGRPGEVELSCRLNSSGGLVGIKLAKSCGDPLSDKAALMVAKSVTVVRNLPVKFIAEHMNSPLTIRYKVEVK